ncbi:MAG: hypothetical protein WC668_02945 [Patescibacteria group bacterium]
MKKRYEIKLGDGLLYAIASELLEDLEARLKEKGELVKYEAGNIFIDDNNKVDYGSTTPVKDVREAFHQLGLTLFRLATGMDWQPEFLPTLNSQYKKLIISLISNRIVSLSQARILLKPPNKKIQTLKKIISPVSLILGWLFCGFVRIAKGTKNWFCEHGDDLTDIVTVFMIPCSIIIAAVAMTVYLYYLSVIFLPNAVIAVMFIFTCVMVPAIIAATIVHDTSTYKHDKPVIMAFFITALVVSTLFTFKTPSYLLSKNSSIILINRSDGEFYKRFAIDDKDTLLAYDHRFVNLFAKKYTRGIAAAKDGLAVEASLDGNELRLAVGYTLLSNESYLKNLQTFHQQEGLEEYLTDVVRRETIVALTECLPTETTCSIFANPGIASAGSILAGMSEELAQHKKHIIDVISANTQLRLSEAGVMIDNVSIAEWPVGKYWPNS